MTAELARIETVTSRRFIVRREGDAIALRGEESFGDFMLGVSTASAGEEAFRNFAHAILEGLAGSLPDALEAEAARLIDRANALRPEPVVEGPDLPVRYPHTLQPGDLVEVLPHTFSPYVGIEFEVRDVKRGADPLVSRYFVVGDGVEGGVWADGVALIEPRFCLGELKNGLPAVFDRLTPGRAAPFRPDSEGFPVTARSAAESLNAGDSEPYHLSWMDA